MYYRNNGSGLGCLIACVLAVFCLLAILTSPIFWAIAAAIAIYSLVKNYLFKRETMDGEDPSAGGQTYYNTSYETETGTGETYRENGFGGFDEPETVLFDDDITDGTDDPSRMEEVYESNAIDVNDFEVTQD